MKSLFGSENEHRPRTGWRRKHVIEFLMLAVGVVCLGWYTWEQSATVIEQKKAERELSDSMRAGQAEEPQADEKSSAAPGANAERKRTLTTIKRGETIGRVEIPRLRISAIVRSGVDNKTLKRAVGHVPSTALPGERGNVGIAAHRDTFFRNLKGVREGDLIRMVTPEGTWEYQVDSTKIVLPKNVEVLDPTPENAITLVTCYPFNYVGSAPKRFIVRGKQTRAVTAETKPISRGAASGG
jgi:sortase A